MVALTSYLGFTNCLSRNLERADLPNEEVVVRCVFYYSIETRLSGAKAETKLKTVR